MCSLDKLSTFKCQLKSHLFQSALLSSHLAPSPQIRLIHDFGAIHFYNVYVCMYVCMHAVVSYIVTIGIEQSVT